MRQSILLLFTLLLLMQSCEPMPGDEGITLPPINIGLKVSPDTAYVKLGDTVYLTASVPNTLSNGVKLEDGKATINLYHGYISEIPIITFDFEEVTDNIDSKFIVEKGGIQYMQNERKILNIDLLPYGDSLQLSIAFVPLKKGTYTFYIQSMFYEGSKGKTRTQPYYINTNHNFDELWHIPENDYDYDRQYLFAVTD